MTDIVKQEENKPQSVSFFDSTLEGLELFEKACNAYSKIGKKSTQFVADALTKGRAMGVTDPFVCMSMFWEMHDKTADLKTDALQKHLIDTGWILEPFITVEDATPLYYYYNIEEFKLFIKGEGNVFYKKLLDTFKEQGAAQWDEIAKIIKPSLFKKEPNPDLVASGIEVRTNTPYDYRTTLKAIVKDHTGKIVEKQHSYLYSTAVAKGLVHTKDKDGNPTSKVKGTWVDKGWMMRKRCASQLAGIIAPGAAYSAEGKFGYANPEVLDKEHALFVKENGRVPNAQDAEIIDIESTEVK